MQKFYQFIKQVYDEYVKDDCPRLAASLAYYTLFSLPPLLLVLIAFVGLVFDPEDVRGKLADQFQQLLGDEGAKEVRHLIAQAEQPGVSGWASVVGVLLALFGATNAVLELQTALNRVWDVQPDPAQNSVYAYVVKRLTSLAMLIGLAFLLMVSLTVDAILTGFHRAVEAYFQGAMPSGLMLTLNQLLFWCVLTLLFAGIFKVLPDVHLTWRQVIVGALFTALLFIFGKFLIGMYLSSGAATSAFGAAGALVILLIWIYYSSLLVLLGAEFTQVWSRRLGEKLTPEAGSKLGDTKHRE